MEINGMIIDMISNMSPQNYDMVILDFILKHLICADYNENTLSMSILILNKLSSIGYQIIISYQFIFYLIPKYIDYDPNMLHSFICLSKWSSSIFNCRSITPHWLLNKWDFGGSIILKNSTLRERVE